MPTLACKSLGLRSEAVCIELAVLLRRNNRHLVIQLSVLVYGNPSLAVCKCVAVELGCLWLPSQLAEALAEELLVLDVDVLVAEEDDSTLRDFDDVTED